MTRGLGSFLLALCLLLLSRGAWASEAFDTIIKSELGLPPGPRLCITCHESPNGGPGGVVKPFGLAAIKLGLQKLDVEKLKEVLQQMEATNVDSDCDGIGDIAELRRGSDPNSSSETAAMCADALEPPRYGCFCSISALSAKQGTGPSGAFASAGLFAVLLVLRRSRRARWR